MIDTIQDLLVTCQQVNLFDVARKSCKDITMGTYDRIKKAREAAGYSQKELAKQLNVSQQAVQQWENANGTQPKTLALNKLASLLSVSVEWLLNGTEDVEELPHALAARCPLISWEDAKNWPLNKNQLMSSKDKIKYPSNQVLLQANCYMLRVNDSAMMNQFEGVGFQRGMYIIVNPLKKHKNKDFVVAKKNNYPELIFRQYINDGSDEYLLPLNLGDMAYKRIDITPEYQICGVVIAMWGLPEPR